MVFESLSAARYLAGMNALNELMKKHNLKDARVAEILGVKQPQIWRLRNFPHGKNSRPMTLAWARRLAPVFGVAPTELLPPEDTSGANQARSSINFVNDLRLTPGTFGRHDEESKLSIVTPAPKPIPVEVRGETAAGLWFEHDQMIDEGLPPIPYVPGKYANLEQFSYKVSGTSMDRVRINHGDYVICVDYFMARSTLQTGDIVVVERRNGHLIERSCKELNVTHEGFELWPRSSDPRFQEPIRISRRDGTTADDGTIIEIVGLVIAVHIPIGR